MGNVPMTREERLSLAIAEFHEAKPTEPPSVMPAHPLMGSPSSPGGWWVWTATDVKLVGSTGTGHFEAVSEWHPADCMTPYNAMRLLKELGGVCWVRATKKTAEFDGQTLEFSIAEAFAKAFSLEVE